MPPIKRARKHVAGRGEVKTEMMRVDHDFANACRAIAKRSGCSVAQVTRDLFNSDLADEVTGTANADREPKRKKAKRKKKAVANDPTLAA